MTPTKEVKNYLQTQLLAIELKYCDPIVRKTDERALFWEKIRELIIKVELEKNISVAFIEDIQKEIRILGRATLWKEEPFPPLIQNILLIQTSGHKIVLNQRPKIRPRLDIKRG